MKMTALQSIKYGDFLEQNIYRHDGLLALPKGVSIRNAEQQYLEELQLQYVQVAPYYPRVYSDDETLAIIEDVVSRCSLWSVASAKKMIVGLRKRLGKKKKILSVLTLMREADHFSFTSSLNMALIVGQMLMVDEKMDKHLIDIVFYTLLHDIGKVKVSKIVQKEGGLTENEFKKVQEHPRYSMELLEKFGYSRSELGFVMQTHERFDGTGYPLRIRGYEIQPIAQVVGVAEMYNALSSFRPHRPSFHPIEVAKQIEDETNKGFAEDYVRLFLEKFNPYQVGTKVELNNGMSGEIINVNPKIPLFPMIGVYNQENGQIYTKINLYRYRDVRIARVHPRNID